MDPRVREHAATILDHSVELEAGDTVAINAPPVAEDLVVALYEGIGARGATPMRIGVASRSSRAYRRAVEPDDLETPPHLLATIEESDVVIGVRGDVNTHETSDVPPETNAAWAAALKPIQEAYHDKRWCGTQYPAPANAQDAEMSTEAYADFVYDAVNKDWTAQRERQAKLAERLSAADEVHVVSGEETDVTMSVAGNPAENDYGQENLPGGEVFTAPIPDSVEGTVRFDLPVMTQGREIEDAYLRFEDGEVVEHGAAKNEAVLTEVLNTDDGARRLGELGIGMNRDIDRFTANMLFDEKMGGTVHLAIGDSIDETVAADAEGNESVVHLDMLTDMSADSRIELDGEVVQRDGTFWFEDGF